MKKSFTLIELLVVIAIIGLLAAILIPTITTAMEKGKRTTCTSNLKEIGTGLIMYAGNYDGKFPDVPAYCGPDDDRKELTDYKGTECVLNALYWTTLPNAKLYVCPTTGLSAEKSSKKFLTYGDVSANKDKDRNISYAFCSGMMQGNSDIYGNPDSGIAADFTGVDGYEKNASKRQPNHKDFGIILNASGSAIGYEGKKCSWFSSTNTGFYSNEGSPEGNIFIYPNENRKTDGTIGFEEKSDKQ